MNRKIITILSLGFLFTAFGIISLLVVITKRHPYFVSKKLRIGALIISLSGLSIGCPTNTCYSPAPGNVFQIDQADTKTSTIVINKSVSDSITGKISRRSGNTFSYIVADSSDSIIIKDDVTPIDGTFDEDTEEFLIRVGKTISPGKYELRFFATPKDSVKNINWYERSYPLQITE